MDEASDHHPSTRAEALLIDAITLSDSERTRLRHERFRVSPSEYLQYTVEQKTNVRLALAALLGIDADTNKQERVYVIQAVASHCPDLLTDHQRLQDLLQLGQDKVVELMLMVFRPNVSCLRRPIHWTTETALLALQRYPKYYRHLPQKFRCDKDVGFQAIVTLGVHPSALDRNSDLFRNKELMLKAMAFNAWTFAMCQRDLMNDVEILLMAASSEESEFISQLEGILERNEFEPGMELHRVARIVKPKLDVLAAWHTFLGCIAVADRREECRNSPLKLLQCGQETSIALKLRILSYFSPIVTNVRELSMLKRAWSVVECYYDPW